MDDLCLLFPVAEGIYIAYEYFKSIIDDDFAGWIFSGKKVQHLRDHCDGVDPKKWAWYQHMPGHDLPLAVTALPIGAFITLGMLSFLTGVPIASTLNAIVPCYGVVVVSALATSIYLVAAKLLFLWKKVDGSWWGMAKEWLKEMSPVSWAWSAGKHALIGTGETDECGREKTTVGNWARKKEEEIKKKDPKLAEELEESSKKSWWEPGAGFKLSDLFD